MADAPSTFTENVLLRDAAAQTGTVYVIDLVGFSQLTEDLISAGEKSGTETVTHLVTTLFSELMAKLSQHGIEFGGMAGDALIAWQESFDPSLSTPDLQDLTADICENTWAGLSCRTALAAGAFHVGRSALGHRSSPLIWGDAVTAAFAALANREPGPTNALGATQPLDPSTSQMLASASVSERSSIVIRALTPEQCGEATPAQLSETLDACREICDAFSAEIDNVVQDDKGLLIIIVLPQAQRDADNSSDGLLAALTMGRQPLFSANQTAATFGTIFRCRPQLADHAVTISIGNPINQAAKALGKAAARVSPIPDSRSDIQPVENHPLIGRTSEAEQLREIKSRSIATAQTAALIGDAGIGKTALVRTLLDQARDRSALIEVSPGSRHLPFGCAQDLAEACGMQADQAFSSKGQAALAAALPDTVIIENWQWCDEDSKRLIRRLQAERATGLLLITSRQNVDDIDTSLEIRLTPLDLDQSDQLIEALAPDVLDNDLKRSIFDVSSGTPFWVVQAALHYAEPSKAQSAVSALSGLEGLLTARAQALSDPAIALWRLYCAWRLPLDFEIARGLLATFEIAVTGAHLNELLALGWVATDPSLASEDLRPAHDILADWGSADLPPTFDRRLHVEIARAVTKLAGSPSRIARHWQRAQQPLRATIWYDRAAQVADRAGAHRLTVEHLSQSDALSDGARLSNQTRALERLALLATANWGIGKLRRAKQTLVKFDHIAKALPNSARKRHALQRASAIQSEVGQFAGNSSFIFSGMYRGWRNSGGPVNAHEVKARRDGFIYYLLGLSRLPVSGRFQRLIARAHELGEYRSQTLIGCAAGSLHMSHCKWDKAHAVLNDCHRAIAQTDDRQMLGVVQCLLALCALYQGQADESGHWFERVADTGREQDHQLFRVWGAYGRAEAQLYAGNLVEAKRFAIDAKAKATGLGDLQSVCIIEGVLAQLSLSECDYGAARTHMRNAVRFAAKLPPTNFSTLEGIAAGAHVGCGLIAAGQSSPDIDDMIETGRKALKQYAQVFHVARPRYHYVEGLIAQTNGKVVLAQRKFEKAKRTAAKLGMTYEHDLARAARGLKGERQHGATAEIY